MADLLERIEAQQRAIHAEVEAHQRRISKMYMELQFLMQQEAHLRAVAQAGLVATARQVYPPRGELAGRAGRGGMRRIWQARLCISITF